MPLLFFPDLSITTTTVGAQKYDHVTQLLKDLHWLRVPERITYKLCALTFRCLNDLAPQSELSV